MKKQLISVLVIAIILTSTLGMTFIARPSSGTNYSKTTEDKNQGAKTGNSGTTSKSLHSSTDKTRGSSQASYSKPSSISTSGTEPQTTPTDIFSKWRTGTTNKSNENYVASNKPEGTSTSDDPPIYVRVYLPPEWVDAGTAMGWHGDDQSWPYILPFSFPFFGVSYSTIYVSSNGLIAFTGPDTSYSNSISGLTGKLAIAVAWDDLVTYSPRDIYIWTDSSEVGIRWYASPYSPQSVVANFEAILWANGTIQLNYGYNNGTMSSTIGISDGAGQILAQDVTSLNYIDTVVFKKPPHELAAALDAPYFVPLGQSSLLNATVYNLGSSDESDIVLSIFVNGTDVGSTTILTLLSGTPYTLSYLWTPGVEGVYNVTAYVQPVAGEALLSNNNATKMVRVLIPCILIVDDNDGQYGQGTSLTPFEAALDQAGYEYFVWDETEMGNPTLDCLTMFELVIWTTGTRYGWAVDPVDCATTQSYLAQGGNILLEGEDIAFDHRYDPWCSNVAHAWCMIDDAGDPGLSVMKPGHPVTLGLPRDFIWAWTPPSPDGLEAINGSIGVISYTGDICDAVLVFQGVSGGSGSVVYFGFPLASLGASEAQTLAIDSVNWLTRSDRIAPQQITDLHTISPTNTSITLTWTAPGDNGSVGTATGYSVKYSTTGAITDSDSWDYLTEFTQSWTPQPAGSTEAYEITGLSPGTTYWFAIRAYDAVYNYGDVSNSPPGTTIDTTPPATITDLYASNTTVTSVTLTWTAPGDNGYAGTATGYVVKYSTSGQINDSNWDTATEFTQSWRPQPAGSTETYEITGLNHITKYWFAIKAYDEFPNYCGVSNSPSATTRVAYVRQYLPEEWVESGTAMGWQSWFSSWSYELPFSFPFFGTYYSTIYVSSSGLITFAGPDTSQYSGIPGLSGKLSIAVAWYNWATYAPCDIYIWGNSSQVGIRWYAERIEFFPPNTYANFEAILKPDGTIRLNYGFSDVPDSWTTFTIGISDGTGYIIAEDVHSLNYINTIVFTTDIIPPRTITDLATGAATFTSVTLTWTAPGDDDMSGTATGYILKYSATGPITDSNWDSATTYAPSLSWTPANSGTMETHIVSGLTPDTTYWFAIKTYDEFPNYGGVSYSPSATTLDNIPPATIQDLATSSPTYSSITLSWTAPGDDGMSGTASGYIVKYSTSGPIDASNWDTATTYTQYPSWVPLPHGSTETHVITGLFSDTTYWFAVKAYDKVYNYGLVSNSPSAATLIPPQAYLKVGVKAGDTANYSTSIPGVPFGRINYVITGVSGAIVSGNMMLYYANGTYAGTMPWEFDISTGNSMPQMPFPFLIAANLTAGQPIYAGMQITINETITMMTCGAMRVVNHISLLNVGGQTVDAYWDKLTGLMVKFSIYDIIHSTSGKITLTATSKWIDVTPPSTISDLAKSSPTTTSITLTWTAPGDDGMSGNATGYTLKYSTDGPITDSNWDSATTYAPSLSWTPAKNGTTETHIISGLTPDTTFWFAIKAYDEVPNYSGVSNYMSGKTSDTIPPATITDLTVSATTNSTITLTWTAPGDNGMSGNATGYWVKYSTTGPINASNWASATNYTQTWIPVKNGTTETRIIANLYANTTYWFAIKAYDEASNYGTISSSPSGRTLSVFSTTPSGFFGQNGFSIWTNGSSVVVTSLSTQPSGTGSPPTGMTPFIYFEMQGELAPGSHVAVVYLYYNITRVHELGLNESTLALYRWNSTTSHWDTIPTTNSAINSTCGRLIAYVSHFSYFAVFGTTPVTGGLSGTSILIIASAAGVIVVVLAVVLFLRKKR